VNPSKRALRVRRNTTARIRHPRLITMIRVLKSGN
jgi:hypothetical protein